ncbi:MAG TPA: ABC transporter ATP-binding protein [candidate division Zixibacteria bacterium]|nr:ABC transporter ATP-binding protein [candidate division Zixibacteria bacterium]
MPSLTLNAVCKSFDQNKVLREISIELPAGELLVLLGPSGCGKSTLLRLIAGLEQVDRGEIILGSKRIDQLPPKDRNVAMVFQNYSLYPHMSIAKNLAFPLKVAKVPRSEIDRRVKETATMLGLEARLNDKPGQLSGGQRQRVALGRAIIRQPDLFLLDEPLSNLDADLRVRMRREIVTLQKQMGTTMVYVTHDQAEALTMADRLAVLHEGRLMQVGTPEELYDNPQHLFVAQFLGQPKINSITIDDHTRFARLFGSSVERLPGAVASKAAFVVAVRPEALIVRADGPFEAKVIGSEYLGDHLVLSLNYLGETLAAKLSTDYTPGATVRFALDPDSLMYFDKNSGQRIK